MVGSKTQRSYFVSDKVFQKLKTWLVILARCPRHKTTIYLSDRIVQWLDDVGEKKAAVWFRNYWTGERSTWDLGSAGIGCPNNNCGMESGWGRIRKAVCAGMASFTYQQFLTSFLVYETDQSMDNMSDLCQKHGTIMLIREPILTKPMRRNVCKLDSTWFRMMKVSTGDDSKFRESPTIHWIGSLPSRGPADICEN